MAVQQTPKTEILLEQLLRSFESYKAGTENKLISRHKVINILLDLHYEIMRTLEKGSISDLLTKPDMTYEIFKD